LKGACQEFEAVLTSIIMKEGLRSAQEAGKSISGDDDGDKGSQQYVEIANEQMAYFIGKRGMLGLGDSIYESVRNKMDREA
jgi:Rod binding domain-containing protein